MLIGIVGIPLTNTAPVKEGRFPCERCPCGCSSAEFCWDQCCCHSDIEKLRWAAENGVTPPDFLVARASRTTTAVTIAASKPASGCQSCCGHKNTDSEQCEADAKTALSKNSTAGTIDSSSEPRQGFITRIVLLERAAKCCGIELVWTLLSSAVVDTRQLAMTKPDAPFRFLWPIANEWAESASLSVDPPVPWLTTL